MLIALAATGLWTACQQIPEDDVNMQTIYTGAFFHSGQKISATINSEWEDNNEQTF